MILAENKKLEERKKYFSRLLFGRKSVRNGGNFFCPICPTISQDNGFFFLSLFPLFSFRHPPPSLVPPAQHHFSVFPPSSPSPLPFSRGSQSKSSSSYWEFTDSFAQISLCPVHPMYKLHITVINVSFEVRIRNCVVETHPNSSSATNRGRNSPSFINVVFSSPLLLPLLPPPFSSILVEMEKMSEHTSGDGANELNGLGGGGGGGGGAREKERGRGKNV